MGFATWPILAERTRTCVHDRVRGQYHLRGSFSRNDEIRRFGRCSRRAIVLTNGTVDNWFMSTTREMSPFINVTTSVLLHLINQANLTWKQVLIVWRMNHLTICRDWHPTCAPNRFIRFASPFKAIQISRFITTVASSLVRIFRLKRLRYTPQPRTPVFWRVFFFLFFFFFHLSSEVIVTTP